MKRFYMLFAALMLSFAANAQNKFSVSLKDAITTQPLPGATVVFTDLKKAQTTDVNGSAAFSDIPEGIHKLEYRYLGYTTKYDSLNFYGDSSLSVTILLEPSEGEELEEVVISTTRSSRTIANIPTRRKRKHEAR
jgi:iron complex outermembrane receptor protein